MRHMTLLLASVSFIPLCVGCQRPLDSTGYAQFGERIESTSSMTLGEALSKVDELSGRPVCVKAKIEEVCQNMGCWMMLTDGSHHVRVRFTASDSCKDGFLVPRNAAGRDVFARGVFQSKTITEAKARHYAEDQGQSPAEIEKIVGDRQSVEMLASGVLIADSTTLEPPVQ